MVYKDLIPILPDVMDRQERQWVIVWDMHSGGSLKEAFHMAFIETDSMETARKVFFCLFEHGPDHVTCTCCGPDYSMHDPATLYESTAFHRGAISISKINDPENKWKGGHHVDRAEDCPEGWECEKNPIRIGMREGDVTVGLADYCAQDDVCIIPREAFVDMDLDPVEIPEQTEFEEKPKSGFGLGLGGLMLLGAALIGTVVLSGCL
jgi:hypothetical protein